MLSYQGKEPGVVILDPRPKSLDLCSDYLAGKPFYYGDTPLRRASGRYFDFSRIMK